MQDDIISLLRSGTLCIVTIKSHIADVGICWFWIILVTLDTDIYTQFAYTDPFLREVQCYIEVICCQLNSHASTIAK